jgi:hypothetical protein
MGDAVLAFPLHPAHQDEPPFTFAQRVALVRPPCFWPALPGKRLLSSAERVGLVRLAESIPGEADDEQLVAFIEAMRHAPTGDVVEIGSGGGRTAALLAWLARRYQVGAVLCRDDWREDALVDFEIAVAPVAEGRLNYLQGCDAAGYGPGFAATTTTFGETRYQGRIAMLHLATGTADASAWLPLVAPGGWIVTSGDAGPIEMPRERVCASFKAGGARFVQLKR